MVSLKTGSLVDCILPTMHGRSQQCCELLRLGARSLKSDAKNVQALGGLGGGGVDGGNMNDSGK